MLHHDVFIPMSGFELGRKKKGHDKGERYKIRTAMGSREDTEGVHATAASASHGECSTSPFKREYAGFPEVDRFLKDKGYSNYWQDLNAKNYGVAQNRDRCFMVSLLGEWNYKFPQAIQLQKRLDDYLQDEVDEKYYVKSEKARSLIKALEDSGSLESDLVPKTTGGG